MHEVVFMVMIELGYGRATLVERRLKLANGDVKQHEEYTLEVPKRKWFELKAGSTY